MANRVTMVVDGHLEMEPDDVIEFRLDASDEASKSIPLTLKNLDKDALPIAFKVKTTQPRRYLVRPNQGLIQPGQCETVQIMLVDKDKHQLLESYKSLGRAALDQCKDKFLVQSVAVSHKQALELKTYDAITELWATTTTAVANKKLHVRHTATGGSSQSDAAAHTPAPSSYIPLTEMTKDQMTLELSALRRKYDELVAFSVNLTAERDMLSNTLELTKRDLHRALAGKTAAPAVVPPPKAPRPWVALLALFVVAFGMGAVVQQLGYIPAALVETPRAALKPADGTTVQPEL